MIIANWMTQFQRELSFGQTPSSSTPFPDHMNQQTQQQRTSHSVTSYRRTSSYFSPSASSQMNWDADRSSTIFSGSPMNLDADQISIFSSSSPMNLDSDQASNVSSSQSSFIYETFSAWRPYSPPLDAVASLSLANRAHTMAFSDWLNPEDADIDSKPGPSRAKSYVLIQSS